MDDNPNTNKQIRHLLPARECDGEHSAAASRLLDAEHAHQLAPVEVVALTGTTGERAHAVS